MNSLTSNQLPPTQQTLSPNSDHPIPPPPPPSSKNCKLCKTKVTPNLKICLTYRGHFHGKCVRPYIDDRPNICCNQLVRNSTPRMSAHLNAI